MDKRLKHFQLVYRKQGRHRRKCEFCGKLIADGEAIDASLIQSKKYYPIRGVVNFNKWVFRHESCLRADHDQNVLEALGVN